MNTNTHHKQAEAARDAITQLQATGGTITIPELAGHWGVSGQRIRKLAKDDPTFPKPLHDDVGLYAQAEADAWRAERTANPRRPGPKPKTDGDTND